MKKLLLNMLWYDDRGSLLAAEWVLLAMVLTLGAVAGLIAARDAVTEHADRVTTGLTSR
jgi:hypothetical protein